MAKAAGGGTGPGESGHRHDHGRHQFRPGRKEVRGKKGSSIRSPSSRVLAGPSTSSEPEVSVVLGSSIISSASESVQSDVSQHKVSMAIWGLWNNYRKQQAAPLSPGLLSVQNYEPDQPLSPEVQIDVVLESADLSGQKQLLPYISDQASCDSVSDSFLSARVRISEIGRLAQENSLHRLHIKKPLVPQLDQAIPMCGLPMPSATIKPQIRETGKGVVIGVIDTGFDLSHPMFRDARGRLRVKALWDQRARTFYTRGNLESLAKRGDFRGSDDDGHGTHVASIAGGSLYQKLQGVAPNAEFVLVKTNMLDLDRGVKWMFQEAGTSPCVVNVSLSHHWGPHDGTDASERELANLVGPGKIVVTAAGNDRESHLHVGGEFFTGQSEFIPFDVVQQQSGEIKFLLSGWYDQTDDFDVFITTPTGQQYHVPVRNADIVKQSDLGSEFLLSCKDYRFHNLVQVEIKVSLAYERVTARMLRGWQLHVLCRKAVTGRFDMWFHNRGFGHFQVHKFVEESGTVGMPSTSASVLSVGSCISKKQWNSDSGKIDDYRAVPGSISPFSNKGPTRDGRQKPDLCAPGQYITAALANGSISMRRSDRRLLAVRLLTLEGTSMACPIVTGSVALMLEKKPDLTISDIQAILPGVCRPISPQPLSMWHPASGYGVLDIARALALLP